MTKAVEPDPRPHAPAHFALGLAIAIGNAGSKVGIAQPEIHHRQFKLSRFENYPGMPLKMSRVTRTLPSASRPYVVR